MNDSSIYFMIYEKFIFLTASIALISFVAYLGTMKSKNKAFKKRKYDLAELELREKLLVDAPPPKDERKRKEYERLKSVKHLEKVQSNSLRVTIISGALYFAHDAVLFWIVSGIIIGFWMLFKREEQDRFKRDKHIQTQRNNQDLWGFYARAKGDVWVKTVNHPVVVENTFYDEFSDERKANWRNFYSPWLVITDKYIIVNPGNSIKLANQHKIQYDLSLPTTYAYNGCSPKIRLFAWVLGTPDMWKMPVRYLTPSESCRGNTYVERWDIWRVAYRASLVHDALYQYLHVIPFSKTEVDDLFKLHLEEDGFPHRLARIYHFFVTKGGGTEVSRWELTNQLQCDQNFNLPIFKEEQGG